MAQPDTMSAISNTLPVPPLANTAPADEASLQGSAAGAATKFSEPRPAAHGYGYRPAPNARSASGAGLPAQQSLFLPMLLASLALVGWLGFQTMQLVNEREALQAAYASQQQTVDNAAKLRASLDALAADTQRLADSGNPNAKLLVDELRKRGITISTTPKTPTDGNKP